MKLDESLEDFANRFLNICYRFPERYVHWDHLQRTIPQLVYLYEEQFKSELNITINHKPILMIYNLSINEILCPLLSCKLFSSLSNKIQVVFETSEGEIVTSNISRPPSPSSQNEMICCVDKQIFVINDLGNAEILDQ